MSTSQQLQSVAIHVLSADRERIRAAAARTGRSFSHIVRMAIARELEREDPGAPLEGERKAVRS